MFSFWQSPDEAIRYLRNKYPELHFDYDEIKHYAHQRVFTIAKMMNLDLLKDIQESLSKAYKQGLSYEEWKKIIKPTLAKKGWLGNVKLINPKTKEEKEIYVGSRRLKTIFNTNLKTSLARANYNLAMNSDVKYFRYTAVLDTKTRRSHRALHGLILPKEHNFWNKNYPPNGWNCRCKVINLTEADLKARNLKVSKTPRMNVADPHWAYHHGAENLDKVLEKKAKRLRLRGFNKLSKQVLKNFKTEQASYVWQKSLNDAVKEILVKKNYKTPINFFQIGLISADIAKKVKEILKKDLENAYIMSNKHSISHIREERKGKYFQALSEKELLSIVKVLEDVKTPVSIDLSKNNIIYWFDDLEDKTKINKIVVDLNYNLKKFGVTNYMVTIGKVDKMTEQKKYIKIR